MARRLAEVEAASAAERRRSPSPGRRSAPRGCSSFRHGRLRGPAAPRRIERVAEAHGDDALLLDLLLERGYAHCHTGDCAAGPAGLRRGRWPCWSTCGPASARPPTGRSACRPAGQRVRRAQRRRQRGVRALHTAAVDAGAGAARRAGGGPGAGEPGRRLWGCWQYGRALRTYAEALADPDRRLLRRGRAASVLGRGIVLGSIGRYEEAARLLIGGLDAFRGLDDAWFLAYGLDVPQRRPRRPGRPRRGARREPGGRRRRRAAPGSGTPSPWPGRTSCGKRRCAPPAPRARRPDRGGAGRRGGSASAAPPCTWRGCGCSTGPPIRRSRTRARGRDRGDAARRVAPSAGEGAREHLAWPGRAGLHERRPRVASSALNALIAGVVGAKSAPSTQTTGRGSGPRATGGPSRVWGPSVHAAGAGGVRGHR